MFGRRGGQTPRNHLHNSRDEWREAIPVALKTMKESRCSHIHSRLVAGENQVFDGVWRPW